MARLPSNLPTLLRAAGLKVVEVPGWEKRGRPGAFNPVGILCHHTVTGTNWTDSAVVNLLRNGRRDLAGPLAQFGLGRDGTVYVVAAGRANHAGKAKSSGTVAAGDGNGLYVGIEAFNDGVREPYPPEQYDAYVRLAAFLCQRVTGNSVQTVRGHKETSVTGKVDPRFSMDTFRADVARVLAGNTAPAPKPDPAPALRAEAIHAIATDADKAARRALAAFTDPGMDPDTAGELKHARDLINQAIRVLQALPDWPGSKAAK